MPAPPGHIRTTLSLSPSDRELLDQLAAAERRTLSQEVAHLVQQAAAADDGPVISMRLANPAGGPVAPLSRLDGGSDL